MKINFNQETKKVTISEMPLNCHIIDIPLEANVFCRFIDSAILEVDLSYHINELLNPCQGSGMMRNGN